MNSKTTLFLAVLLGMLVLGYVAVQQRAAKQAETTATATKSSTVPATSRELFGETLGSVNKVAVRRGTDEWVFEKKTPEEGGAAAWQLVRPTSAKVLGHEVDRIAREAGKIQYEVSYKPGEGPVNEENAGLKPPAAVVELTDEAGKTATVEIGKPVSESETYVRKAGDPEIVVAKANLRKLLKAKALEYRDLQLWNFPPEQATRVQVCENPSAGERTCYEFARSGGGWAMEKPVAAKATAKVDEMVRSVARLRLTGWHDEDAAKLKMYGLDPGSLEVLVTTEETIAKKESETAKEGDEGQPSEEPAPPEKRVKTYSLAISDKGPIGEDTKVFVRSGEENAVGTIFKSSIEKLRPVISEWRDMRLVTVDPTSAQRIELISAGKSAALVQKEGNWTFEGDGAKAESHAVTELLAAIKGLKAVSFVEGDQVGDSGKFESPQADVRLTLPGEGQTERITVGGYTDPSSKLLVYVRRGDAGPVAKVKAADLALLLRPPVALRDRTVFSFDAEALAKVDISRTGDFSQGQRQQFTLEKTDGVWSMTAPVAAMVRQDEAAKLATGLASLKAEKIVGEESEATAFGLHEPAVSVTLTVAPAEGESGTNGDRAAQTKQLSLAEHDGKIYAQGGSGSLIYELGRAVYDQLRAEFRVAEVLEFEPKDVRELKLRVGPESSSYVRKDARWVFATEPDLPVDSVKVERVLTEAKSLKTDRYTAYVSTDLDRFGLSEPQYELRASTQPGGKEIVLRVSGKTVPHQSPQPAGADSQPAAATSTTAHFALLQDHEGVFLLDSSAVKNVFLPLSELEKK